MLYLPLRRGVVAFSSVPPRASTIYQQPRTHARNVVYPYPGRRHAASNPILPADRTRRWMHCGLEALRPEARGGQRALPIPTCNRHGMAQWRVEAAIAASGLPLQCPLCQNGHHRHGHAAGWMPEHDEQWQPYVSQKMPRHQHEGVAETIQVQVRDYARTFTRENAPEPRAPFHITVVSCCPRGPRVAAVRHGSQPGLFWVERRCSAYCLPRGYKHRYSAHWEAAWSCAR